VNLPAPPLKDVWCMECPRIFEEKPEGEDPAWSL
jgi:hypothetical protein